MFGKIEIIRQSQAEMTMSINNRSFLLLSKFVYYLAEPHCLQNIALGFRISLLFRRYMSSKQIFITAKNFIFELMLFKVEQKFEQSPTSFCRSTLRETNGASTFHAKWPSVLRFDCVGYVFGMFPNIFFQLHVRFLFFFLSNFTPCRGISNKMSV